MLQSVEKICFNNLLPWMLRVKSATRKPDYNAPLDAAAALRTDSASLVNYHAVPSLGKSTSSRRRRLTTLGLFARVGHPLCPDNE